MDIIKVDVPTFLRLLEFAREDAADDESLHVVAEKAIEFSKRGVLTMQDYEKIIDGLQTNKHQSELEDIRRLGGISSTTPAK